MIQVYQNRLRLSKWEEKITPYYRLSAKNFRYEDVDGLKVMGWENKCLVYTNERKDCIAILVSDKAVLRTKNYQKKRGIT